jgi:hypothetical protein
MRLIYNKNVILSTYYLNPLDMPIRYDLIFEKFETPLIQWTDYPELVFTNNMRVYHSRLETRMAK